MGEAGPLKGPVCVPRYLLLFLELADKCLFLPICRQMDSDSAFCPVGKRQGD